jgi:multiple sugar transport system substrate-binding protein
LVLALATLAASCVGPPKSDEDTGSAAVTLRVACPAGPAEELVKSFSRPWASRRNVTVEVTAYDPTAGPDPAADAWVIAPAELGRWAVAGRLLPVPQELLDRTAGFGWKDLLPQYRELLVWDRIDYAFPLLGDSPVCVYRSDLFAASGHQEAFRKKYGRPLNPPATWEEFADIAEYFQQHAPRDKFEYNLPPLSAGEDGLDRAFFSVAATYARRAIPEEEAINAEKAEEVLSFHYDLKSGQPRIAAPGFVHALALMRRLQACRPKEPAAAPAEAFLKGKAVLCLTDASWVARFQKDRATAVRDKFAPCPVPGGERFFAYTSGAEQHPREPNRVPYLGAAGFLAVVPKESAHAEEAFDLLMDLGGRETSGRIVIDPRWGGGATRMEHLDERTRWDNFDLDLTRTTALRDALRQTLLHRGTKYLVLRLRTPDERSHREALLTELRACLTKGGDPKQALEAVAKRWTELDREKGVEKTRVEYYRSLGLELPR